MNKYRYIWFVWLLVFASSCFEDKGNYDYQEIGEAVIKAIPGVTDNNNRFVCLENEEIKLEPVLEFKDGTTADDYEFIWFRIPQDPQGTSYHYEQADTLAMTQNLDYKVTDSPRDYYLVYKVRNKLTGALSELKFEFIISAVNGWVVLDEDANGDGDIQVIRDEDIVEGGDGRVVKDYFSLNNEGKKMRNTRFMALCTNLSNFYVYSDEGAYILDASTYKEREETSYADLFSSTETLDAISPEAEYLDPLGGNTEILVNNQKIYTVSYRMMGSSQFTAGGGVDDYLAAPVVAPIRASTKDNCGVCFDLKSNRFITIGTWGELVAPVSAGGAFNTGAIDPTFKYEYMNEGKDGETCLIMTKDGESGIEPWLFRANFVTSTPVALDMVNLSALEDIQQAQCYAFGIRGDVMFYATDNTVYTYRYGNESASRFLTVGAGEEIVQMKIYVNSDDSALNGKVLFIATQQGNEGKVYKALFNEMSGIMQDEVQEYTGFGIIKDMYYKK